MKLNVAAGEQPTKSTIKPYPFVENIYYIIFVYLMDCI